MVGYTMLNKNAWKTGLRRSALVAGTALMIMTWGYFLRGCHTSSSQQRRAEAIEEAISSGEYKLADELLGRFGGNNALLGLEDYTGLLHKMDKKKATDRLDQLIADYDSSAAEGFLSEPRLAQLLTAKELEQYRERIGTATETGLYSAIMSGEKKDKSGLCDKYLSKFPKGKDRAIVIREKAYNELDLIIGSLTGRKDLDMTYGRLMDLTLYLNKFQNESVHLGAKPLEVMSSIDLDACISIEYSAIDKKSGTQGDSVLVTDNKGNTLPWNDSYLRERNALIPEGSIGRLLAKDGDDHFIVEFPDIKHWTWTRTYSVSDYWKDDKKDVAEYNENEIMLGKPTNQMKKERFRKAWTELESAMRGYQ